MRLAPVVLAVALASPAVALAEPPPPQAVDAEVARVLSAAKPLKWNHVPPGERRRYGHAEILVEAPIGKALGVAVDFDRYRELHKKLASARVVSRERDHVDVYMRFPVKIGPLRIEQWQVMRFGPTRVAGNARIVEGHAIRGNMRGGRLVLTLRPVGEHHTLLKVDLLLLPNLPATQSMLDEELRDSAHDLAAALRRRGEEMRVSAR
jgi:hypothetical protein